MSVTPLVLQRPCQGVLEHPGGLDSNQSGRALRPDSFGGDVLGGSTPLRCRGVMGKHEVMGLGGLVATKTGLVRILALRFAVLEISETPPAR